MLSIDFEQNFSVFLFDCAHRSTHNGRSNAGVLPSILIKVPGRALCEESNNLVCTRNKTKARQCESAYLSPSEQGKMHVNTVGIQN